jgi:hypothetical protein
MDLYEELRRERDPKSDDAWRARNSWWRTPVVEVAQVFIPDLSDPFSREQQIMRQQIRVADLLGEGARIEARLKESEEAVTARKIQRRAHRPRAFHIDRLPGKQQAMRKRWRA